MGWANVCAVHRRVLCLIAHNNWGAKVRNFTTTHHGQRDNRQMWKDQQQHSVGTFLLMILFPSIDFRLPTQFRGRSCLGNVIMTQATLSIGCTYQPGEATVNDVIAWERWHQSGCGWVLKERTLSSGIRRVTERESVRMCWRRRRMLYNKWRIPWRSTHRTQGIKVLRYGVHDIYTPAENDNCSSRSKTGKKWMKKKRQE